MLASEGPYLSEAPFIGSTGLGECLDLLLASLAKLAASTDKQGSDRSKPRARVMQKEQERARHKAGARSPAVCHRKGRAFFRSLSTF